VPPPRGRDDGCRETSRPPPRQCAGGWP
jgi:hypothetical protein